MSTSTFAPTIPSADDIMMPTPTTPNFCRQLVDEGRLYFESILGSGNFGTVYKARDTSSPQTAPRYFAAKCMGRLLHGTDQAYPIDEEEIRLHGICSAHPNVITLHRRFQHQGFQFIVLELSAGGHLFDAITAGAFIKNDALVRSVFLQLVDTVQFCHAKGVYHRDLKPENILCSADGGDIRLADFGLATDKTGPLHSSSGTRPYMTPEALDRAEHFGWQNDVWALCIILLNLISAIYPWRAANELDKGYAEYLADPAYLRRTFPISRPLNDLLNRCFHSNPDARPSLLQLRAEVAAMERLFASREDDNDNVADSTERSTLDNSKDVSLHSTSAESPSTHTDSSSSDISNSEWTSVLSITSVTPASTRPTCFSPLFCSGALCVAPSLALPREDALNATLGIGPAAETDEEDDCTGREIEEDAESELPPAYSAAVEIVPKKRSRLVRKLASWLKETSAPVFLPLQRSTVGPVFRSAWTRSKMNTKDRACA